MGIQRFEILVKGSLNDDWSDWFEGFRMTRKGDDSTCLCGPIVDNSGLHGLMAKIRDLNLELVSIRRLEDGERSLGDGE